MGLTPKGSRWDTPTALVPAVAAQGHPTYRDLTRLPTVSYMYRNLRDLRDLRPPLARPSCELCVSRQKGGGATR